MQNNTNFINFFNILRKFKTVIRNPIVLLYYIYGKIGYFPIGVITNSNLLNIHIYCINLQNAVKRRNFMEKQVKKAGFTNFEFIEGLDGSLLDMSQLIEDGLYDDESARKYHNRPLRLGEIALSLSHGRVYEKILKEKLNIALILEDDALFVVKRLNTVNISHFPPDWDLVFLSSFLYVVPPKGHITEDLYTTESWKGSTAAYFISFNGASKLAEIYKPVFHAADGLVGRNMNYPVGQKHHFKQQGAREKLNTYLIYPDCILNGSSSGFWGSVIRSN